MRKIVIMVLAGGLLTGGLACGKGGMKMPEMKMPEALREEKPEVMVQNHIALVLKAEDDLRYYREVAGLLQTARDVGWDNRRMLGEIVDYAGRLDGKPETVARYHRLAAGLQIPRTTVVDVAAQRLESGDAQTVTVSQTLLRLAAPADTRGHTDFSHFAQYLSVRQAQPPEKLILWMYDLDASAALWQTLGTYFNASPKDNGSIAAGEHVISEVLWRQQTGLLKTDELNETILQHVQSLSQSRQWPVRLYVAQILAKNPKLRQAEMVKRLSEDENKLVRRVMELTKA